MNMLEKLVHAVAQKIPGTAASIALAKRRLERELRAQGYSRAQAVAMVSARFRNRE